MTCQGVFNFITAVDADIRCTNRLSIFVHCNIYSRLYVVFVVQFELRFGQFTDT